MSDKEEGQRAKDMSHLPVELALRGTGRESGRESRVSVKLVVAREGSGVCWDPRPQQAPPWGTAEAPVPPPHPPCSLGKPQVPMGVQLQ